jgi:hypothetical protein
MEADRAVSQYCVVVMTGSECDDYPLVTCVMETKGPFDSRDEAADEARKYPDWTAPHIMMLTKDDE